MSETISTLPSSMRNRKARMLQSMPSGAPQADDLPADPPEGLPTDPPANELPNDPPAPQLPADDGEAAKWKAKAEEFEQKWKSLDGLIRAKQEENSKLREDFIKMQEQIEELTRKKTVENVVASLPPDEDLTEEERSIYSAAIPAVQKLSRKEAKAIAMQIVQPLLDQIEDLKRNNQKVGEHAAQTSDQLFAQAVQSAVPDMGAKMAHPEWKNFLEKRAPYTRKAYRELIMEAHQARDLEAMKEIFAAFTIDKPTMSGALGAPNATTASRPPNTPQKKPILKASDRKAASENFRKGRISFEKLKQIQKDFAEAEAEGRVDYNS